MSAPHTTAPSRLRDRMLLACLGLVPVGLAEHVLFLLRSYPALADRWGHHIRPIHYYEPLPDFREITEAAACRRRQSPAIDFDMPAQLALNLRLARAHAGELKDLARQGRDGFDFRNGFFGGLDAGVYYALLRDLKPATIVEIGSGYSTQIASRALQRNRREGAAGELLCIEPYPETRLTGAGLNVTLIQQRVEDVSLDLFNTLRAGDVLLIDSSHAVKFGGDVCRVFLDVLPRLQPGVWVHVHDVFFPHDYPAEWLIDKRMAWTEQYLLEAFLAFNRAFVPACALHWLWADHGGALRDAWPAELIPEAGTTGPASFWMTRQLER